MVCISLLAGAAAVVWTDAAPTGSPVLDAVERFVLAAGVSAAGSRARRWTLVLAAALVAIGSSGADRAVGALALLGTIVLVESRLRNRLAGAAIGAVVGVLVLRMELPGPIWVELVVGSAAVAPVLVSGYRRSRPDTRRTLRRVGVGAAVVATAWVGLGLLAAALSAPALVRAAEHSRDAVAAVRDGDGDAAATSMSAASEAFGSADGMVGAWWASGTQLVPGAGANVSAVRDVVSTGSELSDGASVLLAEVDFERLRSAGGGVDLDELAAVAPRVRGAAQQVDVATEQLGQIGSPWLLAPLQRELGRVTGELEQLRRDAARVDLALEHLPAMLGAGAPRRYLVLLGNPAEARDLGGHIGNWVELEAVDGDLRLVEVGGPLDLAVTDPGAWAEVSDDVPPSLRAMNPLRHPQNLSATPDLPTAARLASELVRMQRGYAVDGVAYADAEAFAAFVSMVGPVDVPGAQPPVELTEANAAEFLTLGQYRSFRDDDAAGDALEEVIRTVFDRLTTSQLGTPEQLAELFSPIVAEGRFQVASLHRADAPILDELALQGAVPEVDQHTEVLAVLNRNVGPSKIDSFLSREVTADFTRDAASNVVGVVHIELRNDAPPAGLSPTVIGNASGLPPGTNLTDVTVLTPHPLEAALVDGAHRAAQPVKEGDLWRHTVRVAIPPGGSVEVDLHLSPLRRPPGPFTLAWIGHPAVRDTTVVVNVNGEPGEEPPAAFDGSRDASLRLSAGRWIEDNREAGS